VGRQPALMGGLTLRLTIAVGSIGEPMKALDAQFDHCRERSERIAMLLGSEACERLRYFEEQQIRFVEAP
jgi:hypothetical protein